MKFDTTGLSLAALEAVVKNAESSREVVADDILACMGEGAVYEDEKPSLNEAIETRETPKAVTIKDITKEIAKSRKRRRSLADYPAATVESECKDILIRGAWLERGGSAFLVSTAGTGKSILLTQFAISMVQGLPCCGLKSNNNMPLKCWIIQSEDSDRRVAIDRDDIVAGLRDQWSNRPEIDWTRSAAQVEFVEFTGHTGAAFLEQLRAELEAARENSELPDIIGINPFMDFLGADVTSNADTIAFLSGGVLAQKRTEGLRSILKEFNIASIIVHHTAKPPTEAELGAWIMSDMPEYKACGASYITNWGRSFVTMLKIPGMEGYNMLTAGKNGAGLGWPFVEGGRRIFVRWVEAPSVSGTGTRHFWKMVTDPDELERCYARVKEIAEGKKTRRGSDREELNVGNAASVWAAAIKERREEFMGITRQDLAYKIQGEFKRLGRTIAEANSVVRELESNPETYGLRRVKIKYGGFTLEPEDEL